MADRPSLAPLARLTDETGLLEHARGSLPRREDGYATDDNGRALAIVSSIGGEQAAVLARRYLAFLLHGHLGGGRFRVRLGYDRRWNDDPHSSDADGRAILGIGTAAARGPRADIRADALALFDRVAGWRSTHWRAMANAALGAVEVLEAHPDHAGARTLLDAALESLPRPGSDSAWPWPEPRLRYENARLPHALLRVGKSMENRRAVVDGVRLLDWLIATESLDGHFSFTPVGGRGPGEHGPAFDQQPIEAWAMAEAAWCAMRVAPEERFAAAVERSVGWFDGANDVGVSMIDRVTGGGFDGLERDGVNRNEGAESQLAVLATRWVAFESAHVVVAMGR